VSNSRDCVSQSSTRKDEEAHKRKKWGDGLSDEETEHENEQNRRFGRKSIDAYKNEEKFSMKRKRRSAGEYYSS